MVVAALPRSWEARTDAGNRSSSVERPGDFLADADRLELDERVEALTAELAAETAVLDPAHRREKTGWFAVEFDAAGFHAARELQAAQGVAGENGPIQAVGRVVGDRHRFVFALVRDDRDHRADDFPLCDGRVRVHVGEDGRFHAPPVAEVRPAPAPHELRTLCTAGLDVALHDPALALRDERADLRRLVAGIADRHGVQHGAKAVHQAALELRRHYQPRLERADLTVVAEGTNAPT